MGDRHKASGGVWCIVAWLCFFFLNGCLFSWKQEVNFKDKYLRMLFRWGSFVLWRQAPAKRCEALKSSLALILSRCYDLGQREVNLIEAETSTVEMLMPLWELPQLDQYLKDTRLFLRNQVSVNGALIAALQTTNKHFALALYQLGGGFKERFILRVGHNVSGFHPEWLSNWGILFIAFALKLRGKERVWINSDRPINTDTNAHHMALSSWNILLKGAFV